jgi:hypothetical protein
MSKFQKVVAAAGVVAVVAILGISLGWWGSRGKPVNYVPGSDVQVTPPAPESSTPPVEVSHPPRSRPPEPSPGESQPPPELASSTTNLITDWEDKVDEILGSEGEDAEKVKKMLGMFPRLPEDGQVEVAQHLSNLVPDENYAPLGKYLKDAKLPEGVLDVLLADLLNRPNSLKLPLLVEVASDPQHAKAGEAKDLLELFLEEDYGTDWTKWQAKTVEWLKENPD